MITPALSVDKLDAGYDNGPVLHAVSLSVAPGEVVALLGPNGAGKSTTLRAISGLIRVMGGELSLAGSDLAPLSPSARARAGIAHVPEDRGLFRGLTVAELNAAQVLELYAMREVLEAAAARFAAEQASPLEVEALKQLVASIQTSRRRTRHS